MFEIHPSNWPVAIDAGDPRNLFHERALHEAQAATDWRAWATTADPRRLGIVERLRLAFAGTATNAASERCSCPA